MIRLEPRACNWVVSFIYTQNKTRGRGRGRERGREGREGGEGREERKGERGGEMWKEGLIPLPPCTHISEPVNTAECISLFPNCPLIFTFIHCLLTVLK